MMKERPILMSAPMVRALLDGSKTQTRRVVKPEGADHLFQFRGTTAAAGADEPTGEWAWCGSSHVVNKHIRCPYGKPGDKLWVREAWRAPLAYELTPPRDIPAKTPIVYQADGYGSLPHFNTGKLRPSMFMPCWASRITLEITGVRVERLQDISEADALAEGIERENFTGFGNEPGIPNFPEPYVFRGGRGQDWTESAAEAYQFLWEQINGPDSWEANPWVWLVEFKRAEGGAA